MATAQAISMVAGVTSSVLSQNPRVSSGNPHFPIPTATQRLEKRPSIVGCGSAFALLDPTIHQQNLVGAPHAIVSAIFAPYSHGNYQPEG
jgi:hypothetical protein